MEAARTAAKKKKKSLGKGQDRRLHIPTTYFSDSGGGFLIRLF